MEKQEFRNGLASMDARWESKYGDGLLLNDLEGDFVNVGTT